MAMASIITPNTPARDVTARWGTHWASPVNSRMEMAEMAGYIKRPCEARVMWVQRTNPARTTAIHRSRNSNQLMGS